MRPATRPRVVILGAGPNRIGQGIEFDYACVHAAFALREAGFESVMVNSNPETVSTDYDTSEPPVLRAARRRGRAGGVRGGAPRRAWSSQFGGQTPLELARDAGARRVSRSSGRRPTRSTWRRTGGRFARVLRGARRSRRPPHGEAPHCDEAREVADADRVSGRGAALVRAGRARHGDRLRRGGPGAVRRGRPPAASPDHPVLLDRFLEGAIEVDVDAVCDGRRRVRRRGHGAHRGGGGPLRRLVVPDPAGDAVRRRARPDRGGDVPARPASRGARAAQPPARRQGRADVGARGQSPRVADRSVRLQGDRGARSPAWPRSC